MVYVFFIALTISIPIIFYLSTREHRSWPVIKDRWFRIGIDNSLIFSCEPLGNGSKGEVITLKGEYADCFVMLSLIKESRPFIVIEVDYPTQLQNGLSLYPEKLFNHMAELLSRPTTGDGEEEFEERFIVQDGPERALHKRLHPRVIEQFILLKEQFSSRGSRFEVTPTSLRFERDGLFVDPIPLLPIMDEMVITVGLLSENIEHLLVQ
jgi:hypothetical protein